MSSSEHDQAMRERLEKFCAGKDWSLGSRSEFADVVVAWHKDELDRALQSSESAPKLEAARTWLGGYCDGTWGDSGEPLYPNARVIAAELDRLRAIEHAYRIEKKPGELALFWFCAACGATEPAQEEYERGDFEDCECGGTAHVMTLAEIEAARWLCFHCGEVFASREDAADHFGLTGLSDVAEPPACLRSKSVSVGGQDKAMRDRLETFEHFSPPTKEDMLRFAKAERDLDLQSMVPRERFVLLENALELSRARLQKIQGVSALLRVECDRLRGEQSEATVLQQLVDRLDKWISASGLEVLAEPDDSSPACSLVLTRSSEPNEATAEAEKHVLEGLEREMRKWATMDGGSWLKQPAVTPVNLTAGQGAVIVAELDRLRAENEALREQLSTDRPETGTGSRAELLDKIRSYVVMGKTVVSSAHSPAEIALHIALDEYDSFAGHGSHSFRRLSTDELRQVVELWEARHPGELDRDRKWALVNLAIDVAQAIAGKQMESFPAGSKKSSEGLGMVVPVGDLLTGGPSVENVHVLVPAAVMEAFVSNMEQLVRASAEQQKALNDIDDRITAQNDVDALQLGGREALNDIARRIARLREARRERTGTTSEDPERVTGDPIVRTVWVASDDESDAVAQVAFAWARSEQDALSSTKLSGKRAVRVVVLAAKERSRS